jgi:hypothetical protein
MMTHVFENKEGKQLCCKGGPETIIRYQPKYGGTATNSRYN